MNREADIKILLGRFIEAAVPFHLITQQVAFDAELSRLHAAIDEMQAEIDKLGKDAARYAALKRDFSSASINIDGNHCWLYRRNFSLVGATLDEAIDKANAERGDKT